jgi:hypothetical protein
MNNSVVLTWSEVFWAAQVGIRRHIEALRKGLTDAYGADSEHGWNMHIEGACGEMAFAKYGHLYWDGSVNTFKNGADVSGLHVRTRSKHNYELIIREDDPDDGTFVLVTGFCPNYRIVGCILARNGKRVEWEQDYGGRSPAFFVPHSALKPYYDPRMEEFPF